MKNTNKLNWVSWVVLHWEAVPHNIRTFYFEKNPKYIVGDREDKHVSHVDHFPFTTSTQKCFWQLLLCHVSPPIEKKAPLSAVLKSDNHHFLFLFISLYSLTFYFDPFSLNRYPNFFGQLTFKSWKQSRDVSRDK